MLLSLKRLCLLALTMLVFAAPISASAASSDAPVRGAETAKKKKKCKKKSKSKKGKKAKCKKKRAVGTGSPGLPGKPVDPIAPVPPEPPEPLVLDSLDLMDNPVRGGDSTSGQVELSAPAPAGGQPVTLGSGDPTRVTFPQDSVHIAAGQTTTSFPINTTAGDITSVILTAAIDGSVRNAQLDLVDEADLDSVALDYQCFPDTGLTNFGVNVVSLNVRTAENAVVGLQSSDPFSLEVPSSVTVPADSDTGVFGVNTLATDPSVIVTASYDGVDRTDTASVRDSGSPAPQASTLGLFPASVVVGDSSTGTVSLDCEAPAGGITVNLSTAYAGVTVPATVVIPGGSLSASFPISTVVSATPGDAVITATSGAAVQATLNLRALGT